jgi:hypothetical protein
MGEAGTAIWWDAWDGWFARYGGYACDAKFAKAEWRWR